VGDKNRAWDLAILRDSAHRNVGRVLWYGSDEKGRPSIRAFTHHLLVCRKHGGTMRSDNEYHEQMSRKCGLTELDVFSLSRNPAP
jgi:hypothetical protein